MSQRADARFQCERAATRSDVRDSESKAAHRRFRSRNRLGRRLLLPRSASMSDRVDLHPIAELVALEIEDLSGPALVPAGGFRCAHDESALDSLDDRLELDPLVRE